MANKSTIHYFYLDEEYDAVFKINFEKETAHWKIKGKEEKEIVYNNKNVGRAHVYGDEISEKEYNEF